MSAADGIRARNRAALEAEILRVGRAHLASYGASGLSLRAVARDVGMASSAVYRYVDSRDELLTRLIIAAYDAMADRVDEELAALPASAPAARRFRTIATATRAWARQNPHEYALIYGSPVPDYDAPADRTTAAGTRVPYRLVEVLGGMTDAAAGTPADLRTMQTMLADPVFVQTGVSAGLARRGITAWILVLGAVSAELFEMLGGDTIPDWDAMFDSIVATALQIVEG